MKLWQALKAQPPSNCQCIDHCFRNQLKSPCLNPQENQFHHFIPNPGEDDSSDFVRFKVTADPRTALYDVKEAILNFHEYHCKIVTPWESNYPNSVSFAFPKDSPYFELFKYRVINMQESGSLLKLRTHWFVGERLGCEPLRSLSLGYEKLCGVFTMLTAGFLAAASLCVLESMRSYFFMDLPTSFGEEQPKMKKPMQKSKKSSLIGKNNRDQEEGELEEEEEQAREVMELLGILDEDEFLRKLERLTLVFKKRREIF